ncbi:SPOR domain-containing protein [Rhizobium straminoryzae]|uniref:SPOR domain-containing protein n=1 Tax=Rhizobium straminoryzae TaxID=1387186 RepID=A0A549T944_9HYPH|nr:SPOR domain-containing protein [Rhizobium straminoryzae]TRL38380.1 hypothetical protein FNA46_13125 [Rhizobium straminoryzae]
MADNSVAPGRMSGPDFFADDDPLAELARIAGYDERPEPRGSSRREPAFNLEDELLREFESYDSPRLDPVGDFSLTPEPAFEPQGPVEPAVPLHEMRRVDDRRVPHPADPFAEPDPFTTGFAAHHDVARVDDLIRPDRAPEPAARRDVDASPVSSVDVPSFDAPEAYAAFGFGRDDAAFTQGSAPAPALVEPEQSSARTVAVAPAPAMEPDFELDLISELETSLAPVSPALAGRKTHTRPPAKAYEPGFRMPLTNFVRAAEPVREPVATAVRDTPLAVDPFADADPLTVRPEPVPARSPARMPMEDTYLPAAAESRVTAAEPEPELELDEIEMPDLPAVAARFSPRDEAPVEIERDLRAPPPPAAGAAQPVREEVSADLMHDADFELSLDDLDLDLDFSDILPFDDRASATAAAQPAADRVAAVAAPLEARPVAPRVDEPVAPVDARPAPAVHAPSVATGSVSASAARVVAAPAPRPAPEVSTLGPAIPAFLMNSRSAATVAEPEPRKAAGAEVEDVSAGADPFDPALFAETDDVIETVPELDVPDLTPHEPEQQAPAHSDFDLHLDSELATLIDQPARPKSHEAPRSRATATVATAATTTSQPAAAVAPAPKQELSGREFEDFERALEEDFRRAMAQSIQPAASEDDEDDEPYDVYPADARRRTPRWLLPASAAGLLVIVGVSGYAWFASDTRKLGGDGAPVIIAADTDAVKVAPENPGGKTVPNQDKAVYDRVASGAMHDPKQSSLISSEEQPMDVVQKTLMPDNLPLQGEEEAADAAPAATATADTQDPRLLPQQHGKPGEQAGANGDQLAVMPRRVKTMIVRPDGTLVEQVTDVPAQPAAAKTAAASHSTDPTTSASVPAIAQPQPGAATDMAGVDVAKTTTLTGTAQAPAAAQAPAGVPQPGMPVPTARPSVQPVNVVASVNDQAAARQAAAPQAQAAVAQPAATPAAASAGVPGGGYYIQIASLPSEADAQKSYRNLSSKYASLLGGRAHDIARADVPGKGTFFRVRVAAGASRDEAAALCESYRAAGGTCLIAR